MTRKEAAQMLGSLGGKAGKGKRQTQAHCAAISEGQRRRWARIHDAARVMAMVKDTKGG